jgi:hypothetical protein
MSTDPSQPGPAGQLFVLNPSEFAPHERARLEALGKEPDDYCLLLTGALNMQAVAQQDQSGQAVIILQMIVAVPHAVLPLPLRGIVDAQGNTLASNKAREAIGCAPDVRLLVRRDALAPHVQADLDRARMLRSIVVPPPTEVLS